MIRCNLAVLMAEQNLKITKVSSDTGVSRTTLTALCNNYSQGIQLSTINTLCMYLKVTPEKLISYIPVDIEIKKVSLDLEQIEINLLITRGMKSTECKLYGSAYAEWNNNNEITGLDISINIDIFESESNNSTIRDAFQQIPRTFKGDIEHIITEKVLALFGLTQKQVDADDSFMLSFSWSDELV